MTAVAIAKTKAWSRGAVAWGLCLAMTACTAATARRAERTPADPSSRPGRLVRLPDGRRLDFRCQGAGAPTILLEGGFAATSLAWYKVRPALGASYRVCAYDRAGYGFSDPGPMPRDGAAVALDLDQGLRAAGIPGPFVVVGHSAGGLYVRLFADRRAGDVIGMVLLDPSVEFQDWRLSAIFGLGAGSLSPLRERAARCLDAALRHVLPSPDAALKPCAPSNPLATDYGARLAESLRPSTWRTQISELDTLWSATSTEVARGRASYGAMPLIVLTADGTYADAPPTARAALDSFWTGVHREIAARSTRGREEPVTGSSHMIMLDRPDAVVSAVESVVAAARSSPAQ